MELAQLSRMKRQSWHTLLMLSLLIIVLAISFGSKAAITADKVLVDKSERTLWLLNNDTIIKQYPISLGKNPLGHKLTEGDKKTPEGTYKLDWRNKNSKYYRSLHISYPNDADIAAAKANGNDPGKHIMLHGSPNGFEGNEGFLLTKDWTDGCIAVSNESMDEIWLAVKNGTTIEIRP